MVLFLFTRYGYCIKSTIFFPSLLVRWLLATMKDNSTPNRFVIVLGLTELYTELYTMTSLSSENSLEATNEWFQWHSLNFSVISSSDFWFHTVVSKDILWSLCVHVIPFHYSEYFFWHKRTIGIVCVQFHSDKVFSNFIDNLIILDRDSLVHFLLLPIPRLFL